MPRLFRVASSRMANQKRRPRISKYNWRGEQRAQEEIVIAAAVHEHSAHSGPECCVAIRYELPITTRAISKRTVW
jgi:hypothetical protein